MYWLVVVGDTDMYETDEEFINYCKEIDSSGGIDSSGQFVVQVQSSYDKNIINNNTPTIIKKPITPNKIQHIEEDNLTHSMIVNHIPNKNLENEEIQPPQLVLAPTIKMNESQDMKENPPDDNEDEENFPEREVRRDSMCRGRLELRVSVKAP